MTRMWEALVGTDGWQMLEQCMANTVSDLKDHAVGAKTFDEKEYYRGQIDGVLNLLGFVESKVTEEQRVETAAMKGRPNYEAQH